MQKCNACMHCEIEWLSRLIKHANQLQMVWIKYWNSNEIKRENKTNEIEIQQSRVDYEDQLNNLLKMMWIEYWNSNKIKRINKTKKIEIQQPRVNELNENCSHLTKAHCVLTWFKVVTMHSLKLSTIPYII